MSRTRNEPTATTLRLMSIAAEKRSAGWSWTATAEALHRKLSIVQRWIERYPETWRRLMQDAARQHVQDAGHEALSKLRSQLRGSDARLSLDAAKKLMDCCPPQRPADAADDADSYLDSLPSHALPTLEAALDAVEEHP